MNDFIINNLSYIELAASLFGLVYVVFEVLQKNFINGGMVLLRIYGRQDGKK